MDFLEVKEVSASHRQRQVLADISFSQHSFQRIAIAGETGSGKTSLLRVIGGLMTADRGAVYFEGKRVAGPLERLVPGHPRIAVLSQHFELRNNYRVEEILEYASRVDAAMYTKVLETCRVSSLLQRKTDQLSGGERQRIALARLLVGGPSLLLLDEPFSNLDGFHRDQLRKVLDELEKEIGITCLLVSHEPADSLSWAEKILVLEKGQIIQEGIPEEIYERPSDRYVARLFGKYNLLPAEGGRLRFVRPERMAPATLAAPGTPATPGTLTARLIRSTYYGAYSEWEMASAAGSLLVHSSLPAPGPGEEIALSVHPHSPLHLVDPDF